MMQSVSTVKTQVLDVDKFRRESAKELQGMTKGVVRDCLMMGTRLLEIRGTYSKKDRAKFVTWVQKDVGMSIGTAKYLMSVAQGTKGRLSNLSTKVSFSVLRELVGRKVPVSAIQEIEDRVDRGEIVQVVEARDTITRHKELPTPSEARVKARETGTLVLASDNHYYSGATKEQAQVVEHRRTIVFGIRRAVETLATIEITPKQFLDYALPHQLWTKEEEDQLEIAASWMSKLALIWKERQ